MANEQFTPERPAYGEQIESKLLRDNFMSLAKASHLHPYIVGGSMQIGVESGALIFQDRYILNFAGQTSDPVQTPNPAEDPYYAVLTINISGVLNWRYGPKVNPQTYPEIPQGEMPLCATIVTALTTEITDIEDLRPFNRMNYSLTDTQVSELTGGLLSETELHNHNSIYFTQEQILAQRNDFLSYMPYWRMQVYFNDLSATLSPTPTDLSSPQIPRPTPLGGSPEAGAATLARIPTLDGSIYPPSVMLNMPSYAAGGLCFLFEIDVEVSADQTAVFSLYDYNTRSRIFRKDNTGTTTPLPISGGFNADETYWSSSDPTRHVAVDLPSVSSPHTIQILTISNDRTDRDRSFYCISNMFSNTAISYKTP
jgi:hypothetical protein